MERIILLLLTARGPRATARPSLSVNGPLSQIRFFPKLCGRRILQCQPRQGGRAPVAFCCAVSPGTRGRTLTRPGGHRSRHGAPRGFANDASAGRATVTLLAKGHAKGIHCSDGWALWRDLHRVVARGQLHRCGFFQGSHRGSQRGRAQRDCKNKDIRH